MDQLMFTREDLEELIELRTKVAILKRHYMAGSYISNKEFYAIFGYEKETSELKKVEAEEEKVAWLEGATEL